MAGVGVIQGIGVITKRKIQHRVLELENNRLVTY